MKKTSVESELKREMVVGGFAFLILLGLFYFTVVLSRDTFLQPRQKVEILFKDVMGLGKGDDVVVRGTAIGEIKELKLVPEKNVVKVVCYLQQRIVLKKDCKAIILPTDILGSRHLQIYEGSVNAELLPEGECIMGETPYDFVKEVGAIVRDIRTALMEGGALEDMQQTLKQMRQFSEKLNSGEGTLAMLANDKTLYDDMREISGNLKEISSRIEEGKGLLGRVMSEDDPLYEEARLLFQDVRAAVDDIRETAPLLTFTSVFFGVF